MPLRGGKPVQIQANLIEDLRAALLTRLLADGYKVPQDWRTNPSRVVESYFTCLRRRIPQRPRKVHIAKRLYVPSTVSKAFDALVRRIEGGGELEPFLSKLIDKPKTCDAVLFDWGIFHLHLSERGGGDFAPRSDYVLMGRFVPNDAYLITVLRHPEGEEWSRSDLLHRVHEEWPQSIYHHRAKGVLPNGEKTTDDLVKVMHKKHYSYLFETADGTCYIAPGGGMMSSGLSTHVRIVADRLMNQIQGWQEEHAANPGRLKRLARKHGRAMSGTVTLALELDGPEIYVRWREGAMRFRVGELMTEWHSD